MALNRKHPLPKYETYGGSLFLRFVFCATTIVWLLDNAAPAASSSLCCSWRILQTFSLQHKHFCMSLLFLSFRTALVPEDLDGESWAHAGEPLCVPTRATPSSQLSPLFLLAHRPCALSQGLYHWKLVKGGSAGGWEWGRRTESGETRTCSERAQQMQRTAFFIILFFFCVFQTTLGQ